MMRTQCLLPIKRFLMQDRVQALCEKQPRRNTWRTAIIGKDAFQLWEFKTNMTEWGFQIKSSALTHFSLEVDSPGFQRFVRWLATDLKVGASAFLATEVSHLLAVRKHVACTRFKGPCHVAGFARDM